MRQFLPEPDQLSLKETVRLLASAMADMTTASLLKDQCLVFKYEM